MTVVQDKLSILDEGLEKVGRFFQVQRKSELRIKLGKIYFGYILATFSFGGGVSLYLKYLWAIKLSFSIVLQGDNKPGTCGGENVRL